MRSGYLLQMQLADHLSAFRFNALGAVNIRKMQEHTGIHDVGDDGR